VPGGSRACVLPPFAQTSCQGMLLRKPPPLLLLLFLEGGRLVARGDVQQRKSTAARCLGRAGCANMRVGRSMGFHWSWGHAGRVHVRGLPIAMVFDSQ
jgi:hypothetical protein